MEVNILIDLLLIGILSIVVLPRSPRLYFILVGINLLQYVIWVPTTPGSGQNARFFWQEAYPEAPGTRSARNENSPQTAENPWQLVQRTPDAFASVTRALGGQLLSEPRARSAAGVLQNPYEGAHQGGAGARPIRLRWSSIMMDALTDMDAMWLMLRTCWLAASMALFIQRPLMGASAACANLLPVPFLSRALPYGWNQLISHGQLPPEKTVFNRPETLNEALLGFFQSHGAWVMIVIMATFLAVVLPTLAKQRQRQRNVQSFFSRLDPATYWIRLNGHNHDFQIDEQGIRVGELQLSLAHLRPDPRDPDTWLLGTRTKIQLVPKTSSHQ